MRYLGIDPGQGGGVAMVDEHGALLKFCKMPETERDVLDLLRDLGDGDDGAGPVHAMLENVHASPQMGVSSSFRFGCGYGALRMALIAASIPFDLVTPQRWQGALGCRTGRSGFKGGNKNLTKQRAQQLFPDVKVTHAVADALLLSEYCRRVHIGMLAPPPKPKQEAAQVKAQQTELF